MASLEKNAPESPLRPPAAAAAATHPLRRRLLRADLALRLLLLSLSAASVGNLLASDETKLVTVPLLTSPVTYEAKFRYSAAMIYFLAATALICLYSVLSGAASAFFLAKPSPPAALLLLLVSLDALMAAVMGSAAGAAMSLAYVAVKGNSHLAWHEMCSIFHGFCRQVGCSVAMSFLGACVLLMLVLNSAYSLYGRRCR